MSQLSLEGTAATSAETNGRKRASKAWEYFKVMKVNGVDKAECQHCKRTFKVSKDGSTTILNRHVFRLCPILKLQPSDSLLPIVQCPNCGIDVKRLVSGTTANPQRVFYRCVNYKKKTSLCRLWMWEEDYEAYLRDIGVVGMQSDPDHEDNIPIASIARFDNEIGKLKKQISQIVALAEKIIFFLVINIVVMISILIVIMCK